MVLFKKKLQHRANWNKFISQGKIRKQILNQALQDKNVIYGARSIQRQIGVFSRRTTDWDIYTKHPEKSAKKTEKALDRITRGDHFYVKKGMFKGVFKVMNKGLDNRKGTKDDFGIVDYNKMPTKLPIKRIGGLSYSTLGKEIKAKRKSLASKEFEFRHPKDKEDILRIGMARGVLGFRRMPFTKLLKYKRRFRVI